MTPLRAAIAAGAALLLALATMNVVVWHAAFWFPIGWYAAIIVAAVVFEARRYAPRVDRSLPTWQATGERFIDPSTGVETAVYYEPATGKRDYRPIV